MLADHFNEPLAYVRSLHYLLDFYADRSRHPGQVAAPPTMISAYKVRPQILRMILQELTPLAIENNDAGFALCDAFWDEPYLEFRMLAAMLLGQIPPIPPEPIIRRLNHWLSSDLEFTLVESVMEQAFSRLRKENPAAILQMIQDWLDKNDQFRKQLGLRALLPLINQPEFQNLPVFFRLIQPLICRVPSGLRPDLLDVLAALAGRSPRETAFFLQQTLLLPESEDTPWLIRQSLAIFPLEIQHPLGDAAKNAVASRK